jgi:hypothetical protein
MRWRAPLGQGTFFHYINILENTGVHSLGRTNHSLLVTNTLMPEFILSTLHHSSPVATKTLKPVASLLSAYPSLSPLSPSSVETKLHKVTAFPSEQSSGCVPQLYLQPPETETLKIKTLRRRTHWINIVHCLPCGFPREAHHLITGSGSYTEKVLLQLSSLRLRSSLS